MQKKFKIREFRNLSRRIANVSEIFRFTMKIFWFCLIVESELGEVLFVYWKMQFYQGFLKFDSDFPWQY